MNFIEAVQLMYQQDKRDIRTFFTREIWEEEGTEIYVYTDKGQLFEIDKNEIIEPCDFYISGILGNDWKIYKEESIVRLHDFEEAYRAFKQGFSISRQKYHKEIVNDSGDYKSIFSIEDIEANDWIIKENNKLKIG